MPPGDLALAELPAEPDGAPVGEGGEVHQAAADVAQGDAPGVDLAHRRLHALDRGHDVLLLAFERSVLVPGCIAQPGEAELRPSDAIAVIPQRGQDRPQLRQPIVGGGDVVVVGHGRDSRMPARMGVATRRVANASIVAMRLAGRMGQIGTETAFETAARARALEASGRDIIHLHLGEPDFETPPNIVEAAVRALADGYTHYAPPTGLPVFRGAVAADFSRRRGVEVGLDRVVITPGAKPVMAFTMMALLEPGDEVIVPDPGFPIYESMARFAGATPVPIPLRAGTGFRLDLDELRSLITPRTRMLVINSPQNPTGAVLTRGDLEGVASIAMAHDLVVLADEIYARIVHEGEHHSILAVEGMEERTVVLDGLSKTYAMTGWRLGWGILPPTLVPVFERLLINTVSCTATYAQVAGAEALNGPQDAVDAMVAELRTRRALIVEGLAGLPGVSVPMPSGAFYVFPDVSGTGMTGRTFADRLLQEAGVSVLAGTAFGRHAIANLRVSYANSPTNLRSALARMADFLAVEAGGTARS